LEKLSAKESCSGTNKREKRKTVYCKERMYKIPRDITQMKRAELDGE